MMPLAEFGSRMANLPFINTFVIMIGSNVVVVSVVVVVVGMSVVDSNDVVSIVEASEVAARDEVSSVVNVGTADEVSIPMDGVVSVSVDEKASSTDEVGTVEVSGISTDEVTSSVDEGKSEEDKITVDEGNLSPESVVTLEAI
jgi:hypothetical protein